ncbi:MAG: choice-of-anchor Q domain-containing protein [Solirubrobacteraceae bacterium]
MLSGRFVLRMLAVLGGALALLASSAALASATTITVPAGATDAPAASSPYGCTTSGAGESCPTLRAAIAFANNDTHADTIQLATGLYQLGTGSGLGVLEVDGSEPLTITGQGPTATIIEPATAHDTQLLDVSDTATVTVSGVAFENGGVVGTSCTGTNCWYPGGGGAIENQGTLTITSTAFSGDEAIGGSWGSNSQPGSQSGGVGGAIYNADGVLRVSGSTFSGNSATGGGGCTQSGCDNGGYPGSGGAVYNGAYSDATLTDDTFTNNQAYGGCGPGQTASGSGTSGLCAGGFLTGSKAVGQGGEGGAIYNSGTLRLASSSLGGSSGTANDADPSSLNSNSGGYSGRPGEGGALFDDYAVATLTGDTISFNKAVGGVSTPNGGYAAGGSGGGLYLEADVATIDGGSVSSNVATGGQAGASGGSGNESYGGGVFCNECSLTASGTASSPVVFQDNTADQGQAYAAGNDSGGNGDGGAIYSQFGSLYLTYAQFISNTAQGGVIGGASTYTSEGFGGAIYEYGDDLQGSHLTFTGNIAGADTGATDAQSGSGGAVYAEAGALSLASSAFTDNTAQAGDPTSQGYGGALYVSGGMLPELDEDSFSGNSVPGGYGGAIFSEGGLTVNASEFDTNSAEWGGAIAGDDQYAAITNSTIYNNTAAGPSSTDGYGGGIDASSNLALANDSLVDNAAYGSGDGGNLYASQPSDLTLHDTLLADGRILGGGTNANCYIATSVRFTDDGYNAEDNQADGNECDLSATAGDLVDSTSLDGSLGTLAGNGGPTETVALASGSPAIDAGDPAGCTDAAGNALTSDQRGDARPSGSRCDIGAFEYQYPPATPASTSAPTPSPAPAPSPASSPGPSVPSLSGLAFVPEVFLAVSDGGSTIVYSDSEAGVTSFKVTGAIAGYKRSAKGRCTALAASGKRPKHTSKCTITGTFDTFIHTDVSGSNTVTFAGLQSSGKALPAGSYTLTATPVFDDLTGASATTTFKIG